MNSKPLPPATPIPDTESAGERRLYEYLAKEAERRDGIEVDRRSAEASRRLLYEEERREQAEAMTQIASQVAQVGNVVAEVSRRLASLTGEVDDLKALILKLRVSVSNQGTDLHGLRARLDTLESEVHAIKRRLDSYAADDTEPPTTFSDPDIER